MATKKQRGKLYSAFGKRQTLGMWACDPRCPVSRQGLYMRVLDRGMSVTAAFQEGAFVPGVARVKAAQRLTINGVTKPIKEWLDDPRCKVKAYTIWYRLKNGWPHAAAVLSPPHAPPPPQCRRTRGRPSLVVEAWGEKKTLAQWCRDPRARVRSAVMKRRLDEGYTPEEAISFPRWQRQGRQAMPTKQR